MLINIRNADADFCTRCMSYHKSEKRKNGDPVSALSKISVKYKYHGMVLPADYNIIERLEDLYKVCISFETDDEACIRLSKHGRIEYLILDLVHLFRIEGNDKAKYIYI